MLREMRVSQHSFAKKIVHIGYHKSKPVQVETKVYCMSPDGCGFQRSYEVKTRSNKGKRRQVQECMKNGYCPLAIRT